VTKSTIDDATIQLAAALADGSGEIVALLDRQGHAQVLNPDVLTEVLGYDSLAPTLATLAELTHPDDFERVCASYTTLLGQPGARQAIRHRARHRDGRYVLLQSTIVQRLDDPAVRALLVRTRELRVSHGIVDEPTGDSPDVRDAGEFARTLGKAVQLKLARVWQPGRQAGPPLAVPPVKDKRYDYCLLLIELDRFKMLMGSHGQHVVAAVLGEVAERLKSVLGPHDVLGHLGGGEFAILLRSSGDAEQATRLADRVQDVVGEGIVVGGHRVSTAAIIGIVTSDRPYERAEEVMSDAAAALNRARKQHRRRRRAAFDTKIRLEDQQFITLLTELHDGLKKQQFVLEYQPIISLSRGTLTGFEALIRWRHPERGTVSPADFIPVAEQTGFIVDLGQWVLREACRQMAAWLAEFSEASQLTVSVNLSAEQLGEDLLPLVERTLRESGLGPERLRLEITESAVLNNSEAASRALAMLRLYGVGLSLDDFGTGYASFSYLHQLPIDTLKIDRTFIARLGSSDGSDETGETDIVAAMINLAHTLKLDVVAEGVETVLQAEMLQSMGCDEGQGYLFARPMPPEQGSALIASSPRW
jgi:diguanylate cyclase (GGDEF)-like protein